VLFYQLNAVALSAELRIGLGKGALWVSGWKTEDRRPETEDRRRKTGDGRPKTGDQMRKSKA